MRLKQIKCPNCGAHVDLKDDEKEITCKYCNSTFSVTSAYDEGYEYQKGKLDATNDYYKENLRKSKKGMMLGGIVFTGLFIFFMFLIMCLNFVNNICSKNITNTESVVNESINRIDEEYQKQVEQQNKIIEQQKINSFNWNYENEKGLREAFFVKCALEEITTNNAGSEHLIYVQCGDLKTLDASDINGIIEQLTDERYNVILEYDEAGYVNVFKIEKV